MRYNLGMASSTSLFDFSSVDFLTLFATIAVTLIGWVVALLLQRSNAKYQYVIQVRYEIYKLLLKSSQQTQEKLNELVVTSAPLVLMESSMVPFNLGLKKEYKDVWLPYTEQECLFAAEKKWNEFISSTFDKYFEFSNQYLEMRYIFDGWSSAIVSLIETQNLLNKEVEESQKRILKNIKKLQSYTSKNGHDWRKWNKEEIQEITQIIVKETMLIGMYIHDLMVLVHNELLSKYFKYKKPVRKTLDPEYKVLTENGFQVRLEDNHEQLWKEFQEKQKIETEE